MKNILLLVYIFLFPLVMAGYSIAFDTVVSGDDIAVIVYKMLWAANGAGLILFYQWTYK